MGRIKKTGEDIKKKLELSDYKTDMGCLPVGEVATASLASEPIKEVAIKPANQQAGKKKMTFYLDQDTQTKLNELYSRRLMNNEKVDKSSLISWAINLLWLEDKDYGKL